MTASLDFLRLLQLADSALPVGAAAHSFGLETLAAEGHVTVERIESFLAGALEESGVLEAAFCRAAHVLGSGPWDAPLWLDLNARLSALRLARESRAASARLGRRLLELVAELEQLGRISEALSASRAGAGDVHQAAAAGLAAGVLGLDVDAAVAAWLHQWVTSAVSACQRLLPLGQRQASLVLWRLKGTILEAARDSAGAGAGEAACFLPLVEIGSMRHARLHTRLFIS